jgi:hypothetical protein
LSSRSPALGRVRTRTLVEVILVVVAFVSVLAFFRSYADDTAGGADSYGYVSEALRLSQGHFSRPEEVLSPFGLPENSAITYPLGWVSRGSTETIPTYPFGYPILMLVALRLAGFPAIFWVTPILGAATVVLTYLVGRSYLGYVGGLLAAAFVLVLPNFLMFAAQPMSDVPAAFCAALALFYLLRQPRAIGTDVTLGAAAGLAIWIRPNLGLLVVPIVVWLLLRREPGRLARFTVGLIPFVAVEALINAHLYGAPWTTGYGNPPLTRDPADALARCLRYLRRLNEQQAGVGLILVGFGVAFGRLSWRLRALLLGFAGLFLAFFSFYTIDDAWWYGRFLLPGLPAVALLEASGIVRLIEKVSRRSVAVAGAAAGLAVFAWLSIGFARDHYVFELGQGDLKYQQVAQLVARSIAPRSLVLAVQHSGTLRLYGGVDTMRYDLAPTPQLLDVLRRVQSAGGSIYLVGEDWEIQRIRDSDRRLLLAGADQLGSVEANHTTLFQVNALAILEPESFAVTHRRDVAFGKQIVLRGYDLAPDRPLPGERLAVTLYWQATRVPDRDYSVFVHLEDDAGKIVTQDDSYPVQGRYPTSTWSPGFVIRDEHRLTLPANLASPHLHLVVGLYRLDTMQRLLPQGVGVSPGASFVDLGAAPPPP